MAISRKFYLTASGGDPSDLCYVPGDDTKRWNALADIDLFRYAALPNVAENPAPPAPWPGNGFGFPTKGRLDEFGNFVFDGNYPGSLTGQVGGISADSGTTIDDSDLAGRTILQGDGDIGPLVSALVNIGNAKLKQSGTPRPYYYLLSQSSSGGRTPVITRTFARIMCYPFIWSEKGALGEFSQHATAGDFEYLMDLTKVPSQPTGVLGDVDLRTSLSAPTVKLWPRSRFWLRRRHVSSPVNLVDNNPLTVTGDVAFFGPVATAAVAAKKAATDNLIMLHDYDWDVSAETDESVRTLKDWGRS